MKTYSGMLGIVMGALTDSKLKGDMINQILDQSVSYHHPQGKNDRETHDVQVTPQLRLRRGLTKLAPWDVDV
jgi:hypothetical protein